MAEKENDMFFIFLCFTFTLLRGCIDCIYFFSGHPSPSAFCFAFITKVCCPCLSTLFILVLPHVFSSTVSALIIIIIIIIIIIFILRATHPFSTTGTLLYFSSYFYFSLSIFHPPHFSFNISSIRRSPMVSCSTLHRRPKWGEESGKSDADKPGINRSPVAMRYECVLEEREKRGVLLLLLEQKGKGTTSTTTTTTTLERLMKILLPKVCDHSIIMETARAEKWKKN